MEQRAGIAEFVEHFGLLFEAAGGTRMMGRMVGFLLVCDPPHQSSAQIAQALGASSGTVSTVSRQLVMGSMAERVAFPGDRATYFRLSSGGWVKIMMARMGLVTMMRQAAEQGLSVLATAPAAQRERLEEFRDFYGFIEAEMPRMFERWEESRRAVGPETAGRRTT